MQKAIRLSPFHPPFYLWELARAYNLAGQNEDAIGILKEAIAEHPNSWTPHVQLAGIYSELGRDDEARSAAAETLRLNPDYTNSGWAKSHPFKDPAVLERLLEARRKAGLPD